MVFKSALGVFLQKFPLLIQYGLLGTAAFGFAEFFGTSFLDLVAFVAFYGALVATIAWACLTEGAPCTPRKGTRPW